jgi:ferritin-like metal-binding protein YciE
MEGLIEEGEEVIKAKGNPAVIDAGLICAAQKVEHYEIAGYGTVRTWANQLGNHQAASLLEQTLNEEKQTDEKLNRIAENMVNLQAASAR